MKSLRVQEATAIEASPDQLAGTMKTPEVIASFPGVKRAFVGQPGVRLDVELPGHIQDRFILTWWKPRASETEKVFPFGVQGGRWISGCGEVTMHPLYTGASQVEFSWELELPRWVWFIPGLPALGKLWLRTATKTWLRSVKSTIEAAFKPLSTFGLTPQDIGA